MMRRIRTLFTVCVAVGVSAWVSGGEQTQILPLDAVQPGMKGEWHTVVTGSTIERFELEIIGTMPNGLGPGRNSILARALDPENKLSGPVAGMSGSPVYVDGKLIGAYSYGYVWPKEQAIIGITPIEQMLEILDRFPLAPPERDFGSAPVRWAGADERTGRARELESRSLSGPDAGAWLRPLPTPLALSGFSPEVVAAFREDWAEAGFDVVQGGAGTIAGGAAEDYPLVPGAPVAAVLMHGDFSAASTGTITWADGERILGFGHAFRQWGGVEVPMAGAEIVTIIRNVQLSFKLSKVGPVVGSIFQDRLTGVAGKVGPVPAMVPVRIHAVGEAGVEREYYARMFGHRQVLPQLLAMAAFQSATRVLESGDEQTVRLAGHIDVEGLDPIGFDDVGSGPGAIFGLASGLRAELRRLMENPREDVRVTGVDLRLESVDSLAVNRLREVRLLQEAVSARRGEFELSVTLERFRGELFPERVRVPLPADVSPGDRFAVLVVDAARADALSGHTSSMAETPADIAAQWRKRRPSDAAYVLLLKATDGMQVGGHRMDSLPPSVAAQLAGGTTFFPREPVRERVVWEDILPTTGPFSGDFRISFTVQP